MDPLVSVIIPCHDRAPTIELCVRSVAAQTHPAIETIVVDDASTDDSAALAESAGATVLRRTVNGGPSAARNLGAEHARGEILFFLDADVALDPGAVAAAVAALRADASLGAICGVLRPESLRSRTLVAQYRALQMYHWWLAREGPMEGLHTALCALRADVFREIGPFDPDLRHTEAPEYGRRLARSGYQVRGTAAITGVHDHDHTLRVLLPKVFRRARASGRQWQAGAVPDTAPSRALASGLILAAALSGPLPLATGAAGAALPLALLAAAVAIEGGVYRRVAAHRGLWFGLRFAAIHLLYQLTAAAGAALGTAQRILARDPWRVVALLVPVLTAPVLMLVHRAYRAVIGLDLLPAGDLLIFREAGLAALRGDSPYEFLVGGYGFVYPPFAALVLGPLGLLSQPVAYWVWTTASVLGLQATLWLLLRRFGVTEPGRRWRWLAIATLAALPLSPIFGTLLLGNVNIALVLLILVDLLLVRTRHRGVLIGIAAGIKLTPLIFVPYLLLTGRIRAGLTAGAAFLGTVGLGFLILPDASRSFWNGTFLDSSRTRPPDETAFGSSIRGVVTNLLPGTPAAGWLLASAAVGLAGLAIAVWAGRRGDDLLGIVACGVTGLLVSPLTWYTHWTWCVPVLALAAARMPRLRQPRGAASGPGGSGRALFVVLWLVFALPLPWYGGYTLGWMDLVTQDSMGVTDLFLLLTGVAFLALTVGWLRGAGPAPPLPPTRTSPPVPTLPMPEPSKGVR